MVILIINEPVQTFSHLLRCDLGRGSVSNIFEQNVASSFGTGRDVREESEIADASEPERRCTVEEGHVALLYGSRE